jgi:hypothetical protein
MPVCRIAAILSIMTLWLPTGWAADRKEDTPAAAATRKVLEGKITVEFSKLTLPDALDEIKSLCRDGKVGTFTYRLDTGVSRNITITFEGKNKTVAEVLDAMFKKNGLGYVVISKEKDAYDGAVLIKQSNERGYPAGEGPAKAVAKDAPKEKPRQQTKEKPADDEEKAERSARIKLNLIKELRKNGVRKERVKEQLQDLLKAYPKTKAAGEAREMLDQLNK